MEEIKEESQKSLIRPERLSRAVLIQSSELSIILRGGGNVIIYLFIIHIDFIGLWLLPSTQCVCVLGVQGILEDYVKRFCSDWNDLCLTAVWNQAGVPAFFFPTIPLCSAVCHRPNVRRRRIRRHRYELPPVCKASDLLLLFHQDRM